MHLDFLYSIILILLENSVVIVLIFHVESCACAMICLFFTLRVTSLSAFLLRTKTNIQILCLLGNDCRMVVAYPACLSLIQFGFENAARDTACFRLSANNRLRSQNSDPIVW